MKRRICVLIVLVLLAGMLGGCAPKQYAVKFDANGGTITSGQQLQAVVEGHGAKEPVVSREGYAFSGWDRRFDTVLGDMVVRAQWEPLVHITFDSLGGETVSGELSQTLAPGEMPVAPELARKGFDFTGWDPPLCEASEDVTYTAQWTEKVYSAEEIYDLLDESVVEVTIYGKDGVDLALGSGFFIDEDGTMVTNYHVIDGAYSADVTYYNGDTAPIDRVIAFDEAKDLAIVHVAVEHSSPIAIAERDVVTGESVYALGSSEGLTGTFSEGIVSTARREMEGKQCIQITAPISHGNSGGPCVNRFGEVIGINSMIYIEGQNLNFAIRIHELDTLDRSNPMTMEELYTFMGYDKGTMASVLGGTGYYTIVDVGDDGAEVYEDADYIEWEPNDDFSMSDSLLSGKWTAGYLNVDEGDRDTYAIVPDVTTFMSIVIFPYWREDAEMISAKLLRGDGTEVSGAVFEPTEVDGTEYLIAEVSTAGEEVLYVSLTTAEGYSYPVGPYYEICAEW